MKKVLLCLALVAGLVLALLPSPTVAAQPVQSSGPPLQSSCLDDNDDAPLTLPECDCFYDHEIVDMTCVTEARETWRYFQRNFCQLLSEARGEAEAHYTAAVQASTDEAIACVRACPSNDATCFDHCIQDHNERIEDAAEVREQERAAAQAEYHVQMNWLEAQFQSWITLCCKNGECEDL